MDTQPPKHRLDRWRELDVNHSLSVVLFARVGSDSGAPKPQLVKDAFASERRKATTCSVNAAAWLSAPTAASDAAPRFSEASSFAPSSARR